MALATQAKAAGWLRFEPVTEHVPDCRKLYRSSAPNYEQLPPPEHSDTSQRLTQRAVAFLVKVGIDSIISFNQCPYKPEQHKLLGEAKPPIDYLHLSVQDFYPPTLQQLEMAIAFFSGKKSTLVHCGYGHGRTGTGITALQIGSEYGQTMQPYAKKWHQKNHVEKRAQVSVLAQLT